jgi:hypothetical protein
VGDILFYGRFVDFVVTLLILLALASLLFYPAILMPILILVVVPHLSKLISKSSKGK